MKKTVNQLRIGVFLSYVNLALGSLIPMLYTPIMLRILGQAEHGLYSLANSVVGYLSLLGFGFGTTIIRYISKYRAEENREAICQVYGFFLKLYSGIALVVILFGGIITFLAPNLFSASLTSYEIDTMQTLLPILALHTAITFPISVFNAIIISYERYLYRRVLDILATIITPICNLMALLMGYASVGLAVVSIIIQITMFIPNVVYCTSVLNLRPSFRSLPKIMIGEMVGFSGFVFLASVVDMLFWATDKVILGALLGSVFVSIYQIGGTFNSIVMNLSSSISGVLVPRITGMVAKNTDRKEWSALFVKVGRLQFSIIGLIVSGFAVFGKVFIRLWAGPEYQDAFWVAVLTLFPLCIPLIQNTGISFITAQNKHQFRSVVYFIIAVINVISTYLIVPYMGVIGAALCTCISYLLGQGLIMNIYYYKITGLDIPLFWKNIAKMSIVPAIMLIAGICLLRRIVITNWLTFFALVAVYSLLYIVLMYIFSFNDYEKDILRKPIRKVFNR